MRKLTLALAAASLLFTLNSAVVARASTPQPAGAAADGRRL